MDAEYGTILFSDVDSDEIRGVKIELLVAQINDYAEDLQNRLSLFVCGGSAKLIAYCQKDPSNAQRLFRRCIGYLTCSVEDFIAMCVECNIE